MTVVSARIRSVDKMNMLAYLTKNGKLAPATAISVPPPQHEKVASRPCPIPKIPMLA